MRWLFRSWAIDSPFAFFLAKVDQLAVAPKLMVRGAEITVAQAMGSFDRQGDDSMMCTGVSNSD
jgi:hypothetical protein